MARRIRYQLASSLDGFIAGPNGEIDWIVDDPTIDMEAIFAQFDTLLMGRRTFEALPGGTAMFEGTGVEIVVCSRSLRPEDHPGVTMISEDLGGAVTRLRERPGKDIWLFGGSELFRSLLALGLVDTFEPAVIPVLLGGGLPLLPPPSDGVRLALERDRRYPSGIVLLEYAVTGSLRASADAASPSGAGAVTSPDVRAVAARLASNVGAFRALLEGVGPEQARWKPDPSKWSMIEVVNHLADEEREDFRTRLGLLLEDPAREWPPIDPEGWARDRNYQGRDLAPSFERFAAERRSSVDWLGSLGRVDWGATHDHPRGAIRAGDLLVSWLAHDQIHLRQIVRLGRDYLSVLGKGYSPDYAGPW